MTSSADRPDAAPRRRWINLWLDGITITTAAPSLSIRLRVWSKVVSAAFDCLVAPAMYEQAVRYLVARGWRREELGSGWWWKQGESEYTLGDALEAQLLADDVDLRDLIAGEPEEFWG